MKINSIQFIATVDSTNRYLSGMAIDNKLNDTDLKDFYTVYAGFQQAGKGLAKNVWLSNQGENILMSLYFKPPLPPARQFAFNQFFSLSVWKMLKQYLPEVMIKWPNDIYVNQKKIAGILIEHTIAGNEISHTIAGVGININQIEFDNSLPNPTSLKLETGQNYDILQLINETIDTGKEIFYPLLIDNNYAKLNEEYLACLYRLNEYEYYQIKENGIIIARITGIDDFGRLQMEEKSGKKHLCGMKEVKFL